MTILIDGTHRFKNNEVKNRNMPEVVVTNAGVPFRTPSTFRLGNWSADLFLAGVVSPRYSTLLLSLRSEDWIKLIQPIVLVVVRDVRHEYIVTNVLFVLFKVPAYEL